MWVAIAAIFGLAIGSFLNVVIYRVPLKKSLMPASRCPGCDGAIRPIYNVPVLSWLILRGKCASCESPISPRYPVVELITGILFGCIAWLQFGDQDGTAAADSVFFAVCLVLAASTVALAFIDLDTLRLPNVIVYPTVALVALGLALAAIVSGDYHSLIRAGIAGIALSSLYLVLWFFGGMGLGDVKLAIAIGMALGWIGWGSVVVGTFAAFLFGGVFGIALVAVRRATRKSRIPFGPWMVLGAWTGVFFGEPVTAWYFQTFFGR